LLERGVPWGQLDEQADFSRTGTDSSPRGLIFMYVAATRNALVRKLSAATNLKHADVERLSVLCAETIDVGPGRDLILEGDPVGSVHLILEGMAFRYKLLPDGTRSIVALMVPGDFCDLDGAILGRMDHSIATADRSVIVRVSGDMIDSLIDNYPRLTRALWWCSLVDEATLREWLVNVGRRSVAKRMAHLFCELHRRLSAVGLVEAGSFRLPLTQSHLSDILGASNVHTNRTLQGLRRRRLIAFERSVMTIPDPKMLEAFVEFDANYLHLHEAEHDAVFF
jgi:CRP-like cAMP-binding protein